MKWLRKIFTIILRFCFLVRLKMDDEVTLVLSTGPWTGKLESVTDFQIIVIYDYETKGPKEMYLVVIHGNAFTIEIAGNEVAYAKWSSYRKKFGLG